MSVGSSATPESSHAPSAPPDWDGLLGAGWPTTPGVARGVACPIGLDHLHDALRHGARELFAGRPPGFRIRDADNRALDPADARRVVPEAPTADLHDWVAHLQRAPALHRFQLYLRDAHREPGVYLAARPVLREILTRVGLPRGTTEVDVFLGNYARTSRGVHRDAQHSVAFFLHGRRAFDLWSDDDLRARGGEPPDAAPQPPTWSFDLAAGDMLWWHEDHWHVGRCDGALSVSVVFGLSGEPDRADRNLSVAAAQLLQTLARSPRPPWHPPALDNPALPAGTRHALDHLRALSTDTLDQLARLEWLRRRSALLMDPVPPLRNAHPDPTAPLRLRDPADPLLADDLGEALAVAAHGHAWLITGRRDEARLIDALHAGEAVALADAPAWGGRAAALLDWAWRARAVAETAR